MRQRRRPAVMTAVPLLAALALIGVAGCGQTAARSAALPRALSCLPELQLFAPRPSLPRPRSTSLDASILSRYAVFRRTGRADDAPPAAALAGRSLTHELARDFTLASYYPGAVRRIAQQRRGTRWYAIPAFGRRGQAPPARCQPARARRQLAAQQQRRLTVPVACLLAVGNEPGSCGDCEPFAWLEAEADLFASGGRTDPIVELVPDGVAALRIAYRSGQPITVPVVGNAVVFTPPAPSPLLRELGRRAAAAYAKAVAAADPIRIDWLAADGHVVQTLTPPARAFLAATDVGDLRAPIGG